MTICFLISIAAGFFLQPYVKRIRLPRVRADDVGITVALRRRPDGGKECARDWTYRVKCVDCHQGLAATLRTFPEFDHRPVCFRCMQQRRANGHVKKMEVRTRGTFAESIEYGYHLKAGVEMWDN